MARDVLVIGGGVFGLCVAWACAQRGLSVEVIEADRPGAGASGGIVGVLSPHVPDQWNPKKQFQFQALCAAEAFWSEVAGLSGMSPCYARTGRLMPLLTEAGRDLALTRRDDAARNWGGQARWEVVDSHFARDWVAPEAAEFGFVHETLTGRVFPRAAIAALAAACRAQGVAIGVGERVRTIGEGTVQSSGGTFSAGAVVLAAGVAGFDLLQPVLGQAPGLGVKGQAALLAASAGVGMPAVYADGLYLVPHGKDRVAVGSTSENRYASATGTDAQLEALIDRARAISPLLREAAIVERWAGARPKARRRDPMLGPVPGLAGVYAALGGFKIGFGIAPKVGEVLADMILGHRVDLPASFRVEHHL